LIQIVLKWNFNSAHTQLNLDPRTKDWFLISSEYYPIAVCSVYLAFSLYLGPKLFLPRSSSGNSLKTALLSYNVFILCANIFMTISVRYSL